MLEPVLLLSIPLSFTLFADSLTMAEGSTVGAVQTGNADGIVRTAEEQAIINNTEEQADIAARGDNPIVKDASGMFMWSHLAVSHFDNKASLKDTR